MERCKRKGKAGLRGGGGGLNAEKESKSKQFLGSPISKGDPGRPYLHVYVIAEL